MALDRQAYDQMHEALDWIAATERPKEEIQDRAQDTLNKVDRDGRPPDLQRDKPPRQAR